MNYSLDIEVLTPVHIGNGNELRPRFDFVARDGVTYVLNVQRILDDFWTDDAQQQAQLMSSPAAALANSNLAQHPEWVVNAYRGEPYLGLLREHIRDVFGRAYIPGSSLKGALRTVILRTVLEGVKRKPLTRQDIGAPMNDLRDNRAAKSAASGLERRLAGINPNYDVFRGLQISDTQPAEKALGMINVLVAAPTNESPQGAAVSVEVIKPGVRLSASLKLDDYVLQTVAGRLNLDTDVAKTVRTFARAARFTVDSRVRQEFAHHKEREERAAQNFYAGLSSQLAALNQQKDTSTFFLQVGYAGGWRSKTLLGGLSEDAANSESALLAEVVNDFYLNRGGKVGLPPEMTPGQHFPRVRHMMLNAQGQAQLPLGWLKVTATRVQ